MKRTFSVFILSCTLTLRLSAQTAPPADLVTIKQSFKKLSVLGSVLYFAAHPDDENTRLLAYLAQEKHYRTGYLALTRGDGGQNLIGNEQAELLGLIRTQELLAARRVDGAEQFFSRANDFGFSKGPEETLKIWDHEKILGDAVWVIRKFRPDVIICRFPTTGEGGHGHHTSSAIIAQEAFAAAADPKRFPEQLKYVQPWQTKRLLWNTFNFGATNTTAPNQFKINVGVYNALSGLGYGEVAADSRSNHKTQGFGSARQRGESFEYFKNLLGEAPKDDLLDGVTTSWKRVKDGESIMASLEVIRKEFNEENPERSVPALVQLLGKVERISDIYWRTQKTKELNDLIAACAGLWFESYLAEPTYALGDSITVRSQVLNRYSDKIKINRITIGSQELAFKDGGKVIPANNVQSFALKAIADKITQPYWLEEQHPLGTYIIKDDRMAGNPENPDMPVARFEFIIEGKPIHFERKLAYKYVDPVKGEVYQPLVVAPPVVANITNQVFIFSNPQPQVVRLKLKSFKNFNTGRLQLKVPQGWTVIPENIAIGAKKKGEEWMSEFTISPLKDARNGNMEANVSVSFDQTLYHYGLKEIKYDHVPNITLFPDASAKLVNVDMHIAGKKIGYLPGAGDLVSDALRQAGYDVHILTPEEVLNSDLSIYDAIVTGVRVFNVDNQIAQEQPKLMNYVKNGGNLLIQYNTPNNLLVPQMGPYPFKIVNERVTDENSKVNVIDPRNPIMNYPNKITPADFEGWIQERGLYFTTGADPKYQHVFEMNDAGENALNGSTIVTDYGAGRFVYTSLSFFRQLPAGVPGAYRLFMNMLSKPKGL